MQNTGLFVWVCEFVSVCLHFNKQKKKKKKQQQYLAVKKLDHDSVRQELIRAQSGLISPSLQQFVTLHEAHYSGTHHPRDNMQPHMSTQVAEVQELYRAREHPPKHCSDLQPTAGTSANRTTTLRREGSVATLTETTCNRGRPCHANPRKLHSLCDCQSKECRNRSNGEPSRSVGWRVVSYFKHEERCSIQPHGPYIYMFILMRLRIVGTLLYVILPIPLCIDLSSLLWCITFFNESIMKNPRPQHN